MKLVNKETFNDMRVLGLLNETRFNKNFSVTCINKKGKRKKYYVEETVIYKYLKIKRNK